MYPFKIMESANVRLAQGNWVFVIQLVPALGNKCSGKSVQPQAALVIPSQYSVSSAAQPCLFRDCYDDGFFQMTHPPPPALPGP